jgi:hypothetical protein
MPFCQNHDFLWRVYYMKTNELHLILRWLELLGITLVQAKLYFLNMAILSCDLFYNVESYWFYMYLIQIKSYFVVFNTPRESSVLLVSGWCQLLL